VEDFRSVLFVRLARVALVAAAVVTGCSAGAAGPSVAPQSLTPDSPKIVALGLKFTTSEVHGPTGTPFAIDFDNEDNGVPHNVAIYDSKGTVMFRGEVFNGVAHRTYSVTSLTPGSYSFKCDVHPDMAGTLVVP
jgi:plastocyanin